MNKIFLFSIVLILFSLSAYAQESKSDSLKLKLQTASQKEKAIIFLELSDLSETYDESIGYCNRALNLANEIKDENLQVKIHFASGLVHYSEGKYKNAEESFREALEIYQEKKDETALATTYYWLALTNKYWGKYRKAAEYAQLGLDLNEKLKSVKGFVDVTLVFGYIYQAWGNQKQADIYFRKALEKIGKESKETSNLGMALLGRGNVLLNTGKTDSAKLLFDQSYDIFVKVQNRYGQALSQRDIAHYYILKKDFKKAESHIDNSLKLLKAIGNKRAISELDVLKGQMYAKKGNYTKAIELYLAGQKLAIEMELHEDVVNNYKLISKAYESKKDNAKAYKYFKLYSDLKDSVFDSETFRQLSEMQTKYESEKKERENQQLRYEVEIKESTIQRQAILVIAILLILGLVGALAFIFFKGRQREIKNNEILDQQKKEIEFSHEQITASINYASRIQAALLPDTSLLKDSVQGHFIIFKPRDIVSGDFYWIKQIDKYVVIAIADCTGHGVPGAFMSLLGISFLTELFSGDKVPDAAAILEKLRELVKVSLKQDVNDNTTKDGMDVSLGILNTENLQLQYAGANLPLYLIRQEKLTIYKGVNNPIGVYLKEKPFESIQIQLMKDDNIYLFSDGYMDQFGGSNGGKFKITHFRDALLAICSCDMKTQKQLLENIFLEWKGQNMDQTDDVLVFGMKI